MSRDCTLVRCYMAEVVQLSDEELLEELRKYGESPGPIVDSTSGLYQNKLARLKAQKTKASDEGRSRPSESVYYRTDHLQGAYALVRDGSSTSNHIIAEI